MNTAETITLIICISIVIVMILQVIDDYIKVKYDKGGDSDGLWS